MDLFNLLFTCIKLNDNNYFIKSQPVCVFVNQHVLWYWITDWYISICIVQRTVPNNMT